MAAAPLVLDNLARKISFHEQQVERITREIEPKLRQRSLLLAITRPQMRRSRGDERIRSALRRALPADIDLAAAFSDDVVCWYPDCIPCTRA